MPIRFSRNIFTVSHDIICLRPGDPHIYHIRANSYSFTMLEQAYSRIANTEGEELVELSRPLYIDVYKKSFLSKETRALVNDTFCLSVFNFQPGKIKPEGTLNVSKIAVMDYQPNHNVCVLTFMPMKKGLKEYFSLHIFHSLLKLEIPNGTLFESILNSVENKLLAFTVEVKPKLFWFHVLVMREKDNIKAFCDQYDELALRKRFCTLLPDIQLYIFLDPRNYCSPSRNLKEYTKISHELDDHLMADFYEKAKLLLRAQPELRQWVALP